MSNSSTRLTLFALLNAIEDDLRDVFVEMLASQFGPKELLDSACYDKCVERLTYEEGQFESPSGPQLIVYSDLGDLCQILNANRKHLPEAVGNELKSATADFQVLIPIRNRICHGRPLLFDDRQNVVEIVERLQKMKSLPWRKLKATVARLGSEPEFVLGLDIPTYGTAPNHNLPAPDFDETGFLGRSKESEQLMTLCRGPYPVISILGVGGVGKSALAIKAAYDILDAQDCPFESVVWCSSKTMQLTPREIVAIKDAVSDSLGVLGHVVRELSGSVSSEPIEELIEYLREFRVLVILDNLETVLDERIRDFLSRLPKGSKVLITSRIGVGAYDFPLKIEALQKGESIQLLRALAHFRGVEQLVKASNKSLEVYCARLKHNPGFIKWFVSAVQVGSAPEAVLAQPEMFLDFCISNVYDHLGENSRRVLDAMLTVLDNLGNGELSFLTELSPLDTKAALQQLFNTNMIVMDSRPRGSSYITQYQVSDLARDYLKKHHPVEDAISKVILGRNRELSQLREQLHSENAYSIYTIGIRTKHDLVAAKYLRDALYASKNNDHQTAELYLEHARELAPDYFEVHRVEGWLRAKLGHVAAAKDAYEAAIALAPDVAPVRFWYSQLLLRAFDAESALKELEVGAEIDPESNHIQVEIARCKLYLFQFQAARTILEPLLDRKDLDERSGRILWDLYLQSFRRQADHCKSKQEPYAALDALEQFRIAYSKCPASLCDWRTVSRVSEAINDLGYVSNHVTGDQAAQSRVAELSSWLNTEKSRPTDADLEIGMQYRGTITNIAVDGSHGSITCEDAPVGCYFVRSNVKVGTEVGWLGLGSEVKFVVGRNDKGVVILDVELAADPVDGVRRFGDIRQIESEGKFGFIKCDDRRRLFFHASELVERDKWSELHLDDRVSFVVAWDESGRLCAREVALIN